MTINWTLIPRQMLEEIADQVEEFGHMDSGDYLELLEANDPYVPDHLEQITFDAAEELGGEALDAVETAQE